MYHIASRCQYINSVHRQPLPRHPPPCHQRQMVLSSATIVTIIRSRRWLSLSSTPALYCQLQLLTATVCHCSLLSACNAAHRDRDDAHRDHAAVSLSIMPPLPIAIMLMSLPSPIAAAAILAIAITIALPSHHQLRHHCCHPLQSCRCHCRLPLWCTTWMHPGSWCMG